jgi:hypothetical protein
MHKNMVNVLSNLNTTMRHVFMKDKNLVPLPIQLLEFDEDEQPRHMS